jgi:hypothetical protein
MMILITAALVATQPAQAPNPGAQPAPMQHEGMKKDCCKDCCKDMVAKHEGHGERGGQAGE